MKREKERWGDKARTYNVYVYTALNLIDKILAEFQANIALLLIVEARMQALS